MLKLLLSVTLLVLVFSQKQFPTIPSDFSVVVETTIPSQSLTSTMIEFWDTTMGNRAKIESYNHNDMTALLIFADQGKMYEIDYLKKACRLAHPNNRTRLIGPDGRVSSTRDLFIGTGNTFHYVGQEVHRGINTDKWNTSTSQSGSWGTSHSTIEYWFAVPEWKTSGFQSHPIPVRARVVGTFTNTQGGTNNFEIDYNFISFLAENFVHERGEYVWYVPHYCPMTSEQRDLPTIPETYRTTVSVTNEREKSTFAFSEFVHAASRRIRVDWRSNQTFHSYVHDTARQIQYFIDHNDNFCNQIPWGQRINAGRAMSPSQLYARSRQYQFIYMGVEHIRGISCDKWSTTYMEHGVAMNYTLSWYFATEKWHMFGNPGHRVPVRAMYSGSAHNTIDHIDNFELLWDFSQFVSDANAVPEHVFNVPKYCLVELKPVPLPTLPKTFFTLSQISLPLQRSTFVFQEWYDSENDKIKFEFHTGGNRNQTIIDVKKKLIIRQGRTEKGSSCTSETLIDAARIIDEQGHLRSFATLLQFGTTYGVKYTGQDWIRGIHCDHWFSNFTGSQFGHDDFFWTHELYFAVEGWKTGYGPVTEQRAPVRAITLGYPLRANGRPHHVATFHRVVDFMAFTMGEIPAIEFEPPWGCPGHKTTDFSNEFGWTADNAIGTYAGIGVSFTVVGSIVGLVFGIVFAFYAAKGQFHH